MNGIDYLKGQTFLIGREPNNGRLCVSCVINGQPKTFVIGEMNSVPNSVSRCRPAEGSAHCKISIDADGSIVLTNLKPPNTTYVDGIEITSVQVGLSSNIELGKDRHPLNLSSITGAISKMAGLTPPPDMVGREERNVKSVLLTFWRRTDLLWLAIACFCIG